MTQLANGTSVLLNTQIPEFIVENNPNFVAFLKAYYQWMEDSNNGAVLYQTKNLLNYKDVDATTQQFIQYFVNDFLPYFPQEIVADQRKLIKAAREFYVSKGSLNSLLFLFRVLYGLDASVFLPKENILKASDGKWQIPQALRIVLSSQNQNFDVAELKMRQGVGSLSNATCIIESAAHTIDPSLGIQIVEIYVSNINRPFVAEENLIVKGNYSGNNAPFTFSEKIIGSISNVVINPKNQGLKYNTANTANGYPGDPVVLIGGLANTATARKAVAFVGNVSLGSISGVSSTQGGFGYQPFPNSAITIIGGGGGKGANIVIQTISNQSNVRVANTSIEFQANSIVNFITKTGVQYNVGVINSSGSSGVSVNLNSATFQANTTIPNYYLGYILQVVGGTGSSASPNVAFINGYDNVTSVATLEPPYLGASLDGTSNVVLYSYDNYGFANSSIFINGTSGPGNTTHSINLNTSTFNAVSINDYYKYAVVEYVGGTGVSSGSAALITGYNGTTKIANVIPIPTTNAAITGLPIVDGTTNLQLFIANSTTTIGQALSFANVVVGSIQSFNVINGGYGFKSVPTLSIDSTYETDFSQAEYYSSQANYLAVRQHLKDLGAIANVSVIKGGTGYNPGTDTITVNGAYGYGATFSFTTSGGVINSVTVLTPGEGYIYPLAQTVNLVVNSATGTGAQLVAYGYNEGDSETVTVSQIGQIQDFTLYSRGFDYQKTPNVSLRIMDVVVQQNVYSNGLINISATTNSSVNLYSAGFTPSAINDFYVGKQLQIFSGTGASGSPNSAIISSYNGNTGVAGLRTNLQTVPDTTSKIIIYNSNVDFTHIGMSEADFVWQGADIGNTTFVAYLDNFGSSFSYEALPSLYQSSAVRLYDYSGSLNLSQQLHFSNSGIILSPQSFNIYGNGQAKANAIFLNGLIQYPGYYLNTDGQPSADQYLQANTKYHNFSYVVQIEKSLNDYKNILMNILHPVGMEMLNDMVINDVKNIKTKITDNLSSFSIYSGSSVTANAYDPNGYLVGANTTFISDVGGNTGSFVVIAKGVTGREQTKQILSVANDKLIQMESNTSFLGPGYLQTISFGNSTYTITNIQTTSNANTVNLNTSTFAAVSTVDNYYNYSIVEVLGGSGYISNAINLTTGAGNTANHVNLNTATFAANTTTGYYNNYFLQVVGGTGASASPNTANITAYYGANQIAVLDTNLGSTLDGTSNIVIYAPNTYSIVSYSSANQIATLNTATYSPLDSTSVINLLVPQVSNTFFLPNTANIYGIVSAGDGIAFSLLGTNHQANVVSVSNKGNSITLDIPQNLLVSTNTQSYYYVYPVLSACNYTVINNSK
jgi:hypothetical protein